MFSTTRIITCVVAGALVTAAAYIWVLSLNHAHGLSDYIALSLTCLAIGAGGTAWGAWGVRSRLNAAAQVPAVLGIMVIAVVMASGALYTWAYSIPEGRYARSYGGTGQCLADTAYASSRVHLKVGDEDVITATPSDRDQPKLHLLHASKGTLSPADGPSRHFLAEHGC